MRQSWNGGAQLKNRSAMKILKKITAASVRCTKKGKIFVVFGFFVWKIFKPIPHFWTQKKTKKIEIKIWFYNQIIVKL